MSCIFTSIIFMSCNFMPSTLVRQFHVRHFHVLHFQRPCRVFWVFLPNVIKIDPYNFELYRFKFCAFFSETQCTECSLECWWSSPVTQRLRMTWSAYTLERRMPPWHTWLFPALCRWQVGWSCCCAGCGNCWKELSSVTHCPVACTLTNMLCGPFSSAFSPPTVNILEHNQLVHLFFYLRHSVDYVFCVQHCRWLYVFQIRNWSYIASRRRRCCRCYGCCCWGDLFKKPKAPSFQIGSGWNLAGLFLK